MKILITGAAGQDGILLSRILIKEGHEVIGAVRPTASAVLSISSPGIVPYVIDLREQIKVLEMLDELRPDSIVNLAGFTSVAKSWQYPEENLLLNFDLVKTLSLWIVQNKSNCRILHASSSEIYGGSKVWPQSESTPMEPVTPYGESKALAQEFLSKLVSEYGLDARVAILYNHESPLRKIDFVTRHISTQVASLFLGRIDQLVIGDVSAVRDWGWAPDYVNALHQMLKRDQLNNYVIASGEANKVENFIQKCFNVIDFPYSTNFVQISETSFRQIDPKNLLGDPTKAINDGILTHTRSLDKIAHEMVNWDIRILKDEVNPNTWGLNEYN